MLSLFQDYENAVKVTIALLRKLNVHFTKVSVHNDLQTHPDYPSLFSISALLTKRRIDNVALEVEPANLQQLPTPFIAHTKTAGGSFLLVTSVNGTVKYMNERGEEKEKVLDVFLDEWTNKVLLATATSASGEKDYIDNRKKELFSELRIPSIIAICVGLVFLCAGNRFSVVNWLWPSLLLMIKLSGCVVTGMLLCFEIDKYNPALKNVCSTGKLINCEAVLASKHAKLFNVVSWSEIGFFYFSISFLFLLLSPGALLPIGILSWLNLLTLPYTVFSVLYQWKISRQWCLLCLIVQGLLLLEALIFYFAYWDSATGVTLSYDSAFYAIVSLSLAILFWVFVKPVLKKAQMTDRLIKESSRIKYKQEVFNALLREQKQIVAPIESLGITLGNPQARHTIVKVCNPYCGPCAAAHREIDDLLDNNPNVKIHIIFTATNDEHDARSLPVKHFMALYDKKDNVLTRRALHDWYGAAKKDYKTFSARYKLSGEHKQQSLQISDMEEWCKIMGIYATPTFFVDGFQLPKEYKVEDLKYIFN